MTKCTNTTFPFQAVGRRQVVAPFNGGTITADAGALLWRALEARTPLIAPFAACFRDERDPTLIEHSVEEWIAQRVYGLALGYEDRNDHDRRRADPLLATVLGKADPTGQTRRRADRGKALAGKRTLNRLERRADDPARDGPDKKIAADTPALDRCFVTLFLQAPPQPPPTITLDRDAPDDPLQGHQEGRFFHGYYGHYCYLPRYIFCGDFLLGARLRQANQEQRAGGRAVARRRASGADPAARR